MFILPHSTALDLEGHAYMTYAICLLCIIIFYFQFTNEKDISRASWDYCESIYTPSLNKDSIDIMRSDETTCVYFLGVFENKVEFVIPKRLKFFAWGEFEKYNAQMDEVITLMRQHYDAFLQHAPTSFNASIMYYPDSWNPFKMITASLAHGDFWHIFFNLIFFLAFAPALELLIDNTVKYLGIMLVIMFITGISYSFASLIGSDHPIPTLGLSGVVMGMIGLSAYLMPNAKIRVLVWLFVYARNIYISAWILAVWYIGWDTWDLLTKSNHGGINLIAHVSGGISGYLIGRYWLKETREDTRDDLDDEIEYQRSKRADKYNSINASYSGNRRYIENKQRERQAKKDYDEYMGKVHHYVGVRNDSAAIALMLENYDSYRAHPEIYEEKFQRASEWGDSRALLCLGRLCINLLMETRQYKRIIPILEKCQSITDEFVLANPGEVLLLAHPLIDQQQYEMAKKLISDAEQRYGKYIDATLCQLLEIKLLWHYLDQQDQARQIINSLLINPDEAYKQEILELAKNMRRFE